MKWIWFKWERNMTAKKNLIIKYLIKKSIKISFERNI